MLVPHHPVPINPRVYLEPALGGASAARRIAGTSARATVLAAVTFRNERRVNCMTSELARFLRGRRRLGRRRDYLASGRYASPAKVLDQRLPIAVEGIDIRLSRAARFFNERIDRIVVLGLVELDH